MLHEQNPKLQCHVMLKLLKFQPEFRVHQNGRSFKEPSNSMGCIERKPFGISDEIDMKRGQMLFNNGPYGRVKWTLRKYPIRTCDSETE